MKKRIVKNYPLVLTPEEIALLPQALGITEKAYSDFRKQAVDLASVRGISDAEKTKLVQQSLLYWDHACKFTDLCIKINEYSKGLVNTDYVPLQPNDPQNER